METGQPPNVGKEAYARSVVTDAVFCCGLGSLLYGVSLVHGSLPWIVFGVVVVALTVYSRAKGP